MADKKKAMKFVDATARRKWDLDDYEERAKERQAAAANGEAVDRPQPTAGERKPLQARTTHVDLESRVGKSRTVITDKDVGAGYYCAVCDCTLKDHMTYLGHINGKRHQQMLGMSMVVERSTLQDVLDTIAACKQRLDDAKRAKSTKREFDYDKRIALLQEEENVREAAFRAKKVAKRRRKQALKQGAEEGTVDDEIAATMGFSGFRGNK